jgi:DNA-binding FadR family transcriptional regulator
MTLGNNALQALECNYMPSNDSAFQIRQAPKASDLLAEEMRGRIIGQALEPGSPLPSEGDLIRDLGLSRATVREALRLLEADGLISIKRGPGGGIVVRHPEGTQITRSIALMLVLSEAPLRDLFQYRKAVEPATAALAAVNATAEQRDYLKQAVEEPENDTSKRVNFHMLVAALSGNALYELNIRMLHDLIEWHVSGESLSEQDVEETSGIHLKIAHAIIAKDSAEASRLMLRHLESFEERMQQAGRLNEPIIPRSRWNKGTQGWRRA